MTEVTTTDLASPEGQPYHHLSPETVLDAIESLGYITDARCFALNSYENRVYQVGIEDSTPLIAKFYRPGRWTNEQILEEHEFTLQLHDLELPIVPPMVDKEGQTLHEYEGFRFTLFERKGGHAPDLDNYDNLLVLGRFMGRLHALGSEKPFEHRPNLDISTFGQQSQHFLLEHFLPETWKTSYEQVSNELLKRIEEVFNVHPINDIRLHGDCHPGNILWRDDAPHFVDFDDSRNGPAIQDLWMLLSGDRRSRQLQLSEIVAGYNEFYDINPKEIILIEALRALRLMHYSAWLAQRWQDPTFPENFPWFDTDNYWQEHINDLREQIMMMDEPPLALL